MAVNFYAQQQIILAQFQSQLAQEVISGGVPDSDSLLRTNGLLVPYVVIRFSTPRPVAADRSFGGARRDGTTSFLDALCIGPTDDVSRQVAGNLIDKTLGYKSADMGELISAPGAGTFVVLDAASKPQAYITTVPFSYSGNTIVDS